MSAPASVNLLAVRITRLIGAAPIGLSQITPAAGQLLITPRVQAGRRVAFTRAGGDVTPIFSSPSRLIGADLILALCAPDPLLLDMLTGGTMDTDADSVPSFYAPPAEGTVGDADGENGVSVEAWSAAAQGDELTGEYHHWVLPKTHWIDGPSDLRYGPLDVVLTGYAERSSGFGHGPGGDWPWPSTEPWQFAITESIPMLCDDGYTDIYSDIYECA